MIGCANILFLYAARLPRRLIPRRFPAAALAPVNFEALFQNRQQAPATDADPVMTMRRRTTAGAFAPLACRGRRERRLDFAPSPSRPSLRRAVQAKQTAVRHPALPPVEMGEHRPLDQGPRARRKPAFLARTPPAFRQAHRDRHRCPRRDPPEPDTGAPLIFEAAKGRGPRTGDKPARRWLLGRRPPSGWQHRINPHQPGLGSVSVMRIAVFRRRAWGTALASPSPVVIRSLSRESAGSPPCVPTVKTADLPAFRCQ